MQSIIMVFLYAIVTASIALSVTATNTWAASPDLITIYRTAETNDSHYQQALKTLQARDAKLQFSDRDLKPTISISSELTRSESNRFDGQSVGKDTSKVYSLNLVQTLFDLSHLNAAQQGKLQRFILQAEKQSLHQDFIIRVVETYLDALLAGDDLRLAQRQERTLGQQLTQAQERFEVGLISVTDVLDAQARLDEAQVDTLSAANRVDITMENLALLTNATMVDIARLSADYPIVAPQPTAEAQWLTLAQAHSPALLIARQTLEQTKKTKRLAKQAYIPTFTFVGRYSDDWDSDNNADFNTDLTRYGIQMELPLYLGGAISGTKKQTELLWLASKDALDFEQRRLKRDIHQWYARTHTDIKRVLARERSIQSNKSALKATQAGYEAGTRNIIDVLMAQQLLFSAERQYAKARYDYIKDFFRLHQTAGILQTEQVTDLNQWLEQDQPQQATITTTAAEQR